MAIDPTPIILLLLGLSGGVLATWWLTSKLRKRGGGKAGKASAFREERIVTQTIAERVQAVGKLVALEVFAKEIATATTGWAWLPPVILSQARLAMIFNFEKQYYVDLTRVRSQDITPLEDDPAAPAGAPRKPRYRMTLPPLEGQLRLIDVTPYDIQNARVLGLLDVIPMTADRQRELMKRAQAQAAELYQSNDRRYQHEARRSAERHLRSLMELFGIEVEVEWADDRAAGTLEQPLKVEVAPRNAVPA